MNPYTYTDEGKTYRRISKRAARSAYERGEEIVICPCNLRPGRPWRPEGHFWKAERQQDFDALVNSFEWYNCANSETGLYSSFFICD